MTFIKLLMTATFALVAGWFVESARADEAYVCEGGRIAYVKLGQLERMKREDPCIASYYAGSPARGGAPASTGTPGASSSGAAKLTPATSEPVSAQPSGSQGLKLINVNESGRWFTQRQATR